MLVESTHRERALPPLREMHLAEREGRHELEDDVAQELVTKVKAYL